jgi:hypothetical protein
MALLDRAGQVSVSNTGTLVLRPEAQDRSRLVWFDRTGRETDVIGTPTDYWQVALSPDNTHIAVVRHDYLSGSFAVWMAPANSGQLEPVSSSNRALDPTWSPDSKRSITASGSGRFSGGRSNRRGGGAGRGPKRVSYSRYFESDRSDCGGNMESGSGDDLCTGGQPAGVTPFGGGRS